MRILFLPYEILAYSYCQNFKGRGCRRLTATRYNIHQTMTYAHFAPDYLNDTVRFNPLENHLKPA